MLTAAEQYQCTKAFCFGVNGRGLAGFLGLIALLVTQRSVARDALELLQEAVGVDVKKSETDVEVFHVGSSWIAMPRRLRGLGSG
jgi:hypothetical protein